MRNRLPLLAAAQILADLKPIEPKKEEPERAIMGKDGLYRFTELDGNRHTRRVNAAKMRKRAKNE
jgi:hypothetical protein